MSENFGSGKHSAVSTCCSVPSSPLLDDVVHALRERVVPVVERLHDHEPGAVGDRRHLFGLRGVGGERLLAQHVLAGLERGDRPLRVQPVRQWVVDRVDVGIGEQVRVGAVHARDAVLGRERVGTGPIAGRDGDHLGLRGVACGLDDGRRRDARRRGCRSGRCSCAGTVGRGACARCRRSRPPPPLPPPSGVRPSATRCRCISRRRRYSSARSRSPTSMNSSPARGTPVSSADVYFTSARTEMLARRFVPRGRSSSIWSPTATSPSVRCSPAPSIERSASTHGSKSS